MYPEIPPANGVIIHPGAVGDCLLTLPLAAYMKKALKLRCLDFIGRMDYIAFYSGRTCIDRVRSLDSIPMHRFFEDESAFVLEDKDRLWAAFESYEYIVSFLGHDHPSFENNLLFTVHSTHSAEVMLLPLAPEQEDVHVSDFYQALLQKELQLEEIATNGIQTVYPLASDYSAGQELLERINVQSDQPIILIQPGSGSPAKCWHLENFLQTACDLTAQGKQVVFLLGPAEQDRFKPEDLDSLIRQWPTLLNLSLTQVLQVLTQTDLFLGNDSGISHLAAAMGKPAVVLFGPAGLPQRYRPLGKQVVVVQPDPESFSAPIKSESDRVVILITSTDLS